MGRRLKKDSHSFAISAVQKSQLPIAIPSTLTEDEQAMFLQVHSVRQTDEWREDDLQLIAEYARVTVQIEKTSLELSECNFDSPALLGKYAEMRKIRDNLRTHLRLNIHSMDAAARMRQGSAAKKIVANVSTPTMQAQPTAPKIDWSILDV